MTAHKHRANPHYRLTRSFFGPVTLRENPAAHGNVCHIDTCQCGAVRFTNINGTHSERGRWLAQWLGPKPGRDRVADGA